PQPQPQPQAQQQAADFSMSLLQEALDASAALTRRVKHLEYDKVAQALEITKLKKRERMIDDLDNDDVVALMDDKEEDKEEAKVVLSMQEDEPAEVHEVVDVVTTAKLITEVVTAASETVTAASIIIFAAEPQVPAATITAAPKSPSLSKKQQVKMDEEYARKLHAELNKDIYWDVAIDHVKQKAKEDPAVQRYQVMKKRPQTEAQARKNIIMYLKNVVDKGADGRGREQSNTRKLNKEVEDLKRHLEIVPDEDDDVYTEATPLARKVPVVDYEIIHLNNKPHYKIIRADGTHQFAVRSSS
nr:hypothetical protein [Tanacetum cinerariifolium]